MVNVWCGSKLLEALDRAVLADELSVVEARQDKGYMIQLVEVQHLRGAVGGDLYAQVLAMQEPMIPIVTYDTLSLPTDISGKRPVWLYWPCLLEIKLAGLLVINNLVSSYFVLWFIYSSCSIHKVKKLCRGTNVELSICFSNSLNHQTTWALPKVFALT